MPQVLCSFLVIHRLQITTENSLRLSTIWMIGSSMLLRINCQRRRLKMKVLVSISTKVYNSMAPLQDDFCLCWTFDKTGDVLISTYDTCYVLWTANKYNTTPVWERRLIKVPTSNQLSILADWPWHNVKTNCSKTLRQPNLVASRSVMDIVVKWALRQFKNSTEVHAPTVKSMDQLVYYGDNGLWRGAWRCHLTT